MSNSAMCKFLNYNTYKAQFGGQLWQKKEEKKTENDPQTNCRKLIFVTHNISDNKTNAFHVLAFSILGITFIQCYT